MLSDFNNPPPPTRYIPLTKWNVYHDWPTQGSLRWKVFNAREIGFDRCIKRDGRRILIDERAFFDWVANQPSEAL